MQLTDLIQNVTSVAGVVVAAFGFYFVAKQIRSSAHSDIYAMGLAAKQSLLEYPLLRKYFFENESPDDASEEDLSRIKTIASIYCLYLELIAISADDLSGEGEDWLKYVGKMYDQSPIIRDYLTNFSYAKKLHEAIAQYATAKS